MDLKKLILGLRESNINTAKAIILGLKRIEEAVKGKPVPTEFEVKNTKELNAEMVKTLKEVTEKLVKEIQKIDKEVKVSVKNDLPNLYKLFKKDKDAKDLLNALSKIEKKIPIIKEGKDYTKEIKKITTLIEDVVLEIKDKYIPEIDLSGVEEQLKKIEKKINFKLPDVVKDNQVKVVLDKQQFVDLYNAGVSGSTVNVNNKLIEIRDKVSTEAKQDEIINSAYPSGIAVSETITLTTASTAYSVPSSAPTGNYVLVIYNNSDIDIYWNYENSTSNGVLLPPDGRVVLNLGANQQVYAYCGTAGKTLVASYKLIS